MNSRVAWSRLRELAVWRHSSTRFLIRASLPVFRRLDLKNCCAFAVYQICMDCGPHLRPKSPLRNSFKSRFREQRWQAGGQTMGRGLIYLATIAITTGVSTGAQATAVSQDDFLAATTANLVSLCSAAETDALYTPARNFCQGFLVGTYRMIVAVQAATSSKRKMFCVPANGPTRDQAVAAFTQWASGRPSTLASAPIDGVVEYLIAQYPCP